MGWDDVYAMLKVVCPVLGLDPVKVTLREVADAVLALVQERDTDRVRADHLAECLGRQAAEANAERDGLRQKAYDLAR